jgi:hypothetical protein
MNPKHLIALIRLRYQLTMNQIKKAGKVNYIISIIVISVVLLASGFSFFVGAIGGSFWFQSASANALLVTWNILILLFLVLWMIGLMVELQQTELMSIDKLLHLPISLRGAFFLNYTSSFINTSFILFTPLMLGLAVGMTIAKGWTMLISIPLIFAFLFVVTTLTYQLRGWLSRIMENKRTRGTVIAVITIFFVLMSQVPNLITSGMRGSDKEDRKKQQDEYAVLLENSTKDILAKHEAGEITLEEKASLVKSASEEAKKISYEQKSARRKAQFESTMGVVEKVDTYFPPGWVPLGIAKATSRNWIPALLAIIAMIAIGMVSLNMAYRSSMRKYTGVAPRRKQKGASQPKSEDSNKKLEFLFRKIPFVSEYASAVAVAGFRSSIRAPESKMALLMPLIFGMLGCSFLISSSGFNIPTALRPWVPLGVIMMTMFGVTSLLFNQFGMDRDGFRAFVLSPIPRHDILLGKNLAAAPLALGLCLILICIVQFLLPQGPLAWLSTVVQIPAVYLLYCMFGNLVSVFFPMGIKRGSMQPANPRFLQMLILIFGSMLAPMVLMVPTSFSYGLPMLLEGVFGVSMNWLYLLLSIAQLAVTWFAYAWSLRQLDGILWRREPAILDIVANIPE